MFYNKQFKTAVISVASTVTPVWNNYGKEWLEKLFPYNFECQSKTFSLTYLFMSEDEL